MFPTPAEKAPSGTTKPLTSRYPWLGIGLLTGIIIIAALAAAVGWRSPVITTGYIAAEAGTPVFIYLDYITYPGWRSLELDDLVPLEQPLDLSAAKDGSLRLVDLSTSPFDRRLFQTKWHVLLTLLASDEGQYVLGPISLPTEAGKNVVFPMNLTVDVVRKASDVLNTDGIIGTTLTSRRANVTLGFDVRSRDESMLPISVRALAPGASDNVLITPGPPVVIQHETDQEPSVEVEFELKKGQQGPGLFYYRPFLEILVDDTPELGIGHFFRLNWH